jgi:hypothetical protein
MHQPGLLTCCGIAITARSRARRPVAGAGKDWPPEVEANPVPIVLGPKERWCRLCWAEQDLEPACGAAQAQHRPGTAVRGGRDRLHLQHGARRACHLAPDVPDPAAAEARHWYPVRGDRRHLVAKADRADRSRAGLHGPDLLRLPGYRRRPHLRGAQPARDRRPAADASGEAGGGAARPAARNVRARARRPRTARPGRAGQAVLADGFADHLDRAQTRSALPTRSASGIRATSELTSALVHGRGAQAAGTGPPRHYMAFTMA